MWPSATEPDRGERSALFRQLAAMFSAGLPLHRALGVLGASSPHKGLSGALGQACDALTRGVTLSRALSEHPGYFPPLATQLIKVGESTGGLHLLLPRVADYLEEENRIVLRLRAALTYPLIVLGISLVVLTVVPAFLFQPLQAAMGGHPLPLLARLVLGASALMRSPLGWLLLAGLAFLAVTFWRRVPRATRDRRLLGLRVVRQHCLALMMLALEALYESGVPILQGLPLAGEATGNQALQADLREASEHLRQGATVSEALRDVVPEIYLHLLVAGEQSGRLGQAMRRVARMAREDLEHRLEVALAALEPIALLVMGTLVGVICLATLKPMMALLDSVSL